MFKKGEINHLKPLPFLLQVVRLSKNSCEYHEMEMKLRKSFMFGAAASALLFSTNVSAETLNEALVKAYLNNPQLRAERAELRATDESVSQAMANWRPTVQWDATAGLSHREDNTRTNPGERTVSTTPITSTFSFSQTLFRGFQTESAVDEAEANVKAERWRLVNTEQTVLLDAVTAYSNVIRDKAVLDLNKNNEQVLLRQLEATRDRFEVGELTRTDVSQAQARYSKSTADRIQSEGDLESARATYENVVGESPVELTVPQQPDDLPTSVEEAVEKATKSNPAFLAAYYDELAAMEDIKEQSGQLLPELSLTGSYATAHESSSKDQKTNTGTIGLNLSVPFYQKGTVYSEIREAKQTAAQRRLQMEEQRRDAIEDARKGWEGLVTARARIQSFLDQIRSAEVALDGVQREAAVGSRTVLDVLDAEQELLDAKVSLVRATRDEIVAVYELKQAIGQLTAEAMGLDTAIYDPNVHYDEVRDAWIGTSSVGDIDEMVDVDNN